MNKENLDKIVYNYLEDIPNSYNSEHDELFKWRAVKHFQENFDINSSDFVNMLKESMKETSIFVDNNTVQPSLGLIKLAEADPEVVRNMFKKLADCNSMPISERQEVIENCLDIINYAIKKHMGDTWKFKQDKRTIIFYLTLLCPDDNYFYKSTEAMYMASCIEYYDLATGSNFKLESYYNMCEQIREYISNNEELLAVHNSYLNDGCCEDKNLHLLVFNIIFCANAYGYYEKNSIDYKRKRPVSKKQQKEIEDFAQRDELEKDNIELRKQISEKEDVLSNLDEIALKGVNVTHKKFGKGQIISQAEDNNLIIKFENGDEKSFTIPIAFTGGFITSEDVSILEACKNLERIEKEKEELEQKLRANESIIRMINNRYEEKK